MAVTITVLKKTRGEVAIKAWGSAGSAVVSLATDLLTSDQKVQGTPTVNIIGVNFYGVAETVIHIKRGTDTIMSWQGGGDNHFTGALGFVDTINNTTDITVEISGGEGQTYFSLRKASGYVSSSEEEIFGSHDDPTKYGE